MEGGKGGEEGHLVADEGAAKLALSLPLHRELGCGQELGLQRRELRGFGLAEPREGGLSGHGLRAVAARLQGGADVADELLHGLCGGGGDALALDVGPGPQGQHARVRPRRSRDGMGVTSARRCGEQAVLRAARTGDGRRGEGRARLRYTPRAAGVAVDPRAAAFLLGLSAKARGALRELQRRGLELAELRPLREARGLGLLDGLLAGRELQERKEGRSALLQHRHEVVQLGVGPALHEAVLHLGLPVLVESQARVAFLQRGT